MSILFRVTMYISKFIFGPSGQMELSAIKWWNSKRWEYNLKFLSCLLAAQFLFALVALSLSAHSEVGMGRKILGALTADALILVAVNLIYFLFPLLELMLFKKIYILYRKYTFAFLNLINLGIILGAFIMVLLAKV